MSPELFDLFSRLSRLPRQVPCDDRTNTDAAIREFYSYIHARGVAHCNLGGFQLTEDGKGDARQFSASLMPLSFQQEFAQELARDDYVLLKAGELGPTRPAARFRIGLPALQEIAAFNPASVPVQQECARQGIVEGVAFIGDTLGAYRSPGGRFFGFVFAGEKGSGEHIESLGQELELASYALLDRIAPSLHAHIDGFDEKLTPRERDVLRWLAEGSQRQDIAHRLSISVPTVDMHAANLRRKLGATTLAEAVAKGIRYCII